MAYRARLPLHGSGRVLSWLGLGLGLGLTNVPTLRADTSCDPVLERLGREIAIQSVLGESPAKLSELYGKHDLGFADFLCPGSTTSLGRTPDIDEKSDFELAVSDPTDERTALVITRAGVVTPRRAAYRDGTLADYPPPAGGPDRGRVEPTPAFEPRAVNVVPRPSAAESQVAPTRMVVPPPPPTTAPPIAPAIAAAPVAPPAAVSPAAPATTALPAAPAASPGGGGMIPAGRSGSSRLPLAVLAVVLANAAMIGLLVWMVRRR